jgi:TRAP-type transport system periplasmic protein
MGTRGIRSGSARGAALGRRRTLAGAMAFLAAPALARAALGESRRPYKLKLHHAFASLSCVETDFLTPWARKIEAQSGGRLRFEIFASMELGGRPAELFDQARDRLADIVWTRPSDTPGRFPGIETFELPFVPSRRALVSSKAVEDFCSQNLQDEFREIRPLCFSCADRGVIHTEHPIHAVPDLRGLRLAVSTRFAAETVRVVGGRAEIMPSAQLPFAVSGRVVNGGVVPWHLAPELKLDEMFRAHTDFAGSSLSSTTFVLAMNKTSYDGLPDDLKKIIDNNSGQAAAGMAGAMWDLKARAVAATARRRGDTVVTLPADAVARWRNATRLVIHFWLRRMRERKIDGAKLLASAHALLGQYAGVPEPQPPTPETAPVAATKRSGTPDPPGSRSGVQK